MTEQNLSPDVPRATSESLNPPVQPAQEETVSKSFMTRVVHERYNEGLRKGAEEERKRYQAELQAQQPPITQSPSSFQGSGEVSELKQEISSIKELLQKTESEKAQAEEHRRLAELGSQLKPKIDEARKKYPDYDSVVNQKSLAAVPSLLNFANEVENGGEVMYELLNNPERLGQLCALPDADFVRRAIRNLSNALKTNEQSASKAVPRSPVGQPQASQKVKSVSEKADVGAWAANHRW